ncbi:MAG: glycosyltransferase [Gemmatimonadetes bacterium]|nr:MAG: glycosyltransferase [Gemmatimonadota bacterium]
MLSIIIPIYNEQEILPELFRRVTQVLETIRMDYEVIVVNDGSTDDSLAVIHQFYRQNRRIKCLSFSRNFGHQMAITAGIDHAQGDAVIILDGDLQDPPEIIPQFIDKWREGYDVVYGVRQHRKESWKKRVAYALFYRLLREIANIDIPLDSGDFGLIDRKVADHLRKFPEQHRFVRGLRSWVGFRQTGIPYERDARYAGEVKYTFGKLFTLALDGLMAFTTAPLRAVTIFGFIVSFIAFFSAMLIFIERFLTVDVVPGYATTLISILFLGGVQLIGIGIIGEYIARIYDEVKQRPPYIIADRLGFVETEPPNDKREVKKLDKV